MTFCQHTVKIINMKKEILSDEDIERLAKPFESYLQAKKAKKRWAKVSPEDRSAYGKMMVEKRKEKARIAELGLDDDKKTLQAG